MRIFFFRYEPSILVSAFPYKSVRSSLKICGSRCSPHPSPPAATAAVVWGMKAPKITPRSLKPFVTIRKDSTVYARVSTNASPGRRGGGKKKKKTTSVKVLKPPSICHCIEDTRLPFYTTVYILAIPKLYTIVNVEASKYLSIIEHFPWVISVIIIVPLLITTVSLIKMGGRNIFFCSRSQRYNKRRFRLEHKSIRG